MTICNKTTIRNQFKKYRAEIAGLKNTIDELEQSLEDASYRHEETLGQASRRAEACRRESAERERQDESDRWYREDQLRTATKELERAQSYGDEYGIGRAMDKLKRIS